MYLINELRVVSLLYVLLKSVIIFAGITLKENVMGDMNNSQETASDELKSQIKKENIESAAGSEPSYEFVTETIKKRPVNKRRVFLKTMFTIFLGVVFGIVACVTFVIVKPIADNHINPKTEEVEETKPVTLNESVEDEDINLSENTESVSESNIELQIEEEVFVEAEREEPLEETAIEAEDKENAEDEPIEASANGDEKKEVVLDDEKKSIRETASNAIDSENADEGINDIELSEDKELTQEDIIAAKVIEQIKTADRELEISDYTTMYDKIGEVGDQVRKSLAVVSGLSSEMDWFQNIYEGNNSTTGLIVAENGKELLILARTSALSKADHIQVTFCDGSKCDGNLKKSDGNTDLSVVAVNLKKISPETLDEIEMATLGSSYVKNLSGRPVIAIGDPLGVPDSIAIGQITSSASVKYMIDCNASVLTTDIYGSTQASGVITDFKGKVLGIICQDGSNPDTKNLIRAYGISDLKSRIEKISNGQELAYLGIKSIDVTEEAAEEYGVPNGAFVSEVISDSPAMVEGIRTGDVITKMGTTDITSLDDFKEAMLKSQPGDQLMITVLRRAREKYLEFSYEVQLGKLGE